jgi:hypothetical protein
MAQSGTARDLKSRFLRDIPVQIRVLALFLLLMKNKQVQEILLSKMG